MTAVAQDWQSLINSDPTGTATIGSGTNRLLVVVQTAEYSSSFSVSAMTVGGQSATGSYSVDQQTTGTAHSTINAFWWNQSALEAMSGNGISYADNAPLSKRHFNYITLKDVNQTAPVSTSTIFTDNVNSVDLATTSDSDDYVIAVVARNSGNRDVTDWDTLTEAWDDGDDGYRTAAADGSGGDDTTTITGDGIDDDFLVMGLVIKDVSGSGIGAVNAPVATVSGAGSQPANSLKPASVTVSGAGKRKIVWQGGVELTAPAAGTNISASGTPDVSIDAALVPKFSRASGAGSREITLSQSPQAPGATVSGGGTREVKITGSLSTVIPTTQNTVDFPAAWYVAKQVYF
tara:strand:+ start:2574 stop:3614 length:1041 start_codon:yes stop_codon:yes gene_type:complete